MSTVEKLEAMRRAGVTPTILRAMRELTRAQAESDRAQEEVRRRQAKLSELIEAEGKAKTARKDRPGPTLNRKGWIVSGGMNIRYRCKSGIPARAAIRYNDAENASLLEEWAGGKGIDIAEIAKRHQRTENGVSTQLARLGARASTDSDKGRANRDHRTEIRLDPGNHRSPAV